MLQDARFAIRQLFKASGFTVVPILTLALAICANIVIFSAASYCTRCHIRIRSSLF